MESSRRTAFRRAMPCEMCGRDAPLRRATIEGTLMNVCPSCMKFGVEVAGHQAEVTGRSRVVESLERRERRGRTRDIYDQMEEELVPEYPQLVREGRLRKGYRTTEDLAKKISEKKATIDKVEAGTLHPSDTLVKKLERELGVKLMEKPETPLVSGKTSGEKALTLGDLIKRQLEKK